MTDKLLHYLRIEKGAEVASRAAGRIEGEEQKNPHKLATGKWYELNVTISGETLAVLIDGEEVGSFSSEGIAHPTKRTLRLSVPKNAVVDDVKIYSLTDESGL